MWFGKKEIVGGLNHVRKFIDEQQLTAEERIKYNLHLLDKLDGFKIVQRIIVSIVFGAWVFLIANISAAIWFAAATDNMIAWDGFLAFVKTEFIWGPTVAASALYLGGGLYKGGKK